MRYIGSKNKLSPWILSQIKAVYPYKLANAVFADIFAGTGQVGRCFKPHVKQVIANDLEKYGYVLNYHYIKNSFDIKSVDLGNPRAKGTMYHHFSPESRLNRMFFTRDNAEMIDGIRQAIEQQYQTSQINDNQYYWVLASLLEAADKVANTTSVYGAYLKHFKKSALQPLDFKLMDYSKTGQNNEVYQQDANKLIRQIKGDILYLDPPYNHRQYGANYHILNYIIDIANPEDFESDKKTGITTYNKSSYSKRNEVKEQFEDLISQADFSYIFISYNNEGLLSSSEFKKICSMFGSYQLFETDYKRYKADSSRYNKTNKTKEQLHCLIKN